MYACNDIVSLQNIICQNAAFGRQGHKEKGAVYMCLTGKKDCLKDRKPPSLWIGWLDGLEINGPTNTIRVISIRSVYLTTLFLGRLIPLSG